MKAAELGNVPMIEHLIEYRANIAITNNKGRTPLSFAVQPSIGGAPRPNPEAITLLLGHRADMVGHRGSQRLTALDRANKLSDEDKAPVKVWEEFAPSSASGGG